MPLQSRHLMPDGLNYAVNTIRKHKDVAEVDILYREFYRAIVDIKGKHNHSTIKAYIADVYTLTASDVDEVLSLYSDINCIVVISNWNHYTNMAKSEARQNGVGVFLLSQFLEALNCSGKKFPDTGIANETE